MIRSFDEWWKENEAQYEADSLHMSSYHMAKTVWEAADNSEEISQLAHIRYGIFISNLENVLKEGW